MCFINQLTIKSKKQMIVYHIQPLQSAIYSLTGYFLLLKFSRIYRKTQCLKFLRVKFLRLYVKIKIIQQFQLSYTFICETFTDTIFNQRTSSVKARCTNVRNVPKSQVHDYRIDPFPIFIPRP